MRWSNIWKAHFEEKALSAAFTKTTKTPFVWICFVDSSWFVEKELGMNTPGDGDEELWLHGTCENLFEDLGVKKELFCDGITYLREENLKGVAVLTISAARIQGENPSFQDAPPMMKFVVVDGFAEAKSCMAKLPTHFKNISKSQGFEGEAFAHVLASFIPKQQWKEWLADGLLEKEKIEHAVLMRVSESQGVAKKKRKLL
jgi:hypothetical protein